jgi:hypothetical protein
MVYRCISGGGQHLKDLPLAVTQTKTFGSRSAPGPDPAKNLKPGPKQGVHPSLHPINGLFIYLFIFLMPAWVPYEMM